MTKRLDADAAIRALVPINRLPAEGQTRVVQTALLLPFYEGQIVYTQGHLDEFTHYLLDGDVELLWNGKVVKRLAATTKAAKRALDPPGRKRYTVRAATNCTIARFARAELDKEVEQSPLASSAKELEVSEIATEKSSNWMIRMLQSELFAAMPATNIQRIFGCMEEITVGADQVIVKQGEPGDYYYVIEQGYCEVTREIAGGRKEIHLADLGPGDAFGEAALLSGNPRDATVTMLMDGRLMRLNKADFDELIREPLLHGVDAAAAIAATESGAQWLDIRYPEDYAKAPLRNSRNIPLNVLRIQVNRLPKDEAYIVCSDDPAQSAVGVFLLVERGFDVKYLTAPIAALVERYPHVALQPRTADADQRKVIAFPTPINETMMSAQTSQPKGTAMDQVQPPADRLENTIDRIDRLYTQKEFDEALQARVPVEAYADTHTGKSLADLIDDIEERHDAIPAEAPPPSEAPESNVDGTTTEFIDLTVLEAAATANLPAAGPRILSVDSRQPMPAAIVRTTGAGEFHADELAQMMSDFEQRVRGYVDATVMGRSIDIERRYQDKLQRLRQSAATEIRNREVLLRNRYEAQYRKKELVLRAHYKKLMALANKISQQKAQLQQARKQFEEKLHAANALYRQVEDMRRLLRDHLTSGDSRPPAAEPRAAAQS